MAEMTEKQWPSGVQSSIIKELTTHKAALPAGFNQERFALNTVTVISEMLKDKKKKTELCKLTFESMAVCLCKAAYLGLDYFNGECYAIPYGGELNFQTDYKGEIKMCKRFSRNPIKDIFAKVVRQDDFFTEEVDAGVQNVIYRPQPFSNKPMIGAFAIVVFKDGSMIVNMDVLYGFRIFDEDKTLHRQLKGINAVKFMLAHVDRMLEVYQRECETSSNEIIQRRWKVIQMMYLDREKKKSTKEIAEFYNMELSTIQKDAKEARNDLTVLFFGLDAMILHDFGNPMDK